MLQNVFSFGSSAAPPAAQPTEEEKRARELEQEENVLPCLRSMSGTMEVDSVVREMFKYNGNTILEFLCSEMKRFKHNEIEFFLPQLCNLLLTRPHYPKPVEDWLIDLCRNSLHLALRVYFILHAAVEDTIPETFKRARVLERQLLELVLGAATDDATMSFWLDEITMIKSLTRLSTMLNTVPLDQKNNSLRSMLDQLNEALSVGLYLPIGRADEPYSCLLSIVAQDAFCLPTRTRTPFMMFVETAELGGTFSNLESSLCQYRKDKENTAPVSGEIEDNNQASAFKGVPIHYSTKLMDKCKGPQSESSQQDRRGDDVHKEQQSEGKREGGEEKLDAPADKPNSINAQMLSDCDELLATVEEQKKEWTQCLRYEELLALASSGKLGGAGSGSSVSGSTCKEDKGILALSEKLKTIFKKVENDKENLINEIKALQATEKADALVDNPLGDDYFINSVEEFYCDVEKGELKMSKQQKKSPPAPYHRAKHPASRTSFDEAEGEADEWVMVPDTEKEMRRTRYELMTAAYKELWADRKKRIQQSSIFGNLPGWNLQAVIVKSQDDLRQEQMAMQLIKAFHDIFTTKRLPLWLRPYEIVATSSSTGFIEVVPDAVSVDAIKRRNPDCPTLSAYFIRTYGERHTPTFKAALRNFVESLAGYSLVCYFLQIKDRHNGNILLDIYGHIVHIDYGFLLGTGPGNWNFEKAPFKLTAEYVELMGGETSDTFRYFTMLIISGFLEARNHYHRIINIVEMMLPGYKIGCLNETTVPMLTDRFKVTLSSDESQAYAQSLVNEALGSWRTRHYDNYQQWTNGILP